MENETGEECILDSVYANQSNDTWGQQALETPSLVYFEFSKTALHVLHIIAHAARNMARVGRRMVRLPNDNSLISNFLTCRHSLTYSFDSAVMIWLPSHASPASSLIHEPTAPGSMQIMFFHPSFGAKSPMAAAFSSHRFQTVTLGNPSRVILNFGLPSSVTVRGTADPSSAVGGV